MSFVVTEHLAKLALEEEFDLLQGYTDNELERGLKDRLILLAMRNQTSIPNVLLTLLNAYKTIATEEANKEDKNET
jgi:hypothetical protein